MIREAKTENGWVRGIEAADPRITVFKGIPFAAPPIGENRWRAPQRQLTGRESEMHLDLHRFPCRAYRDLEQTCIAKSGM